MKMDHDAPIKYSRAHHGYYYQDPEFSINDIPLTEDDLSSISFAAKTLMQFRDVDLFKQFGSAIDKIFDRVEVSKDSEAEAFIQFEKSTSDGGNEYLSPLLEAIKQSLWVTFDYTSFVSGQTKPRKVLPLLLKEYRNRWYLISFDNDKSDFITYALDRMTELTVTNEPGTKPTDFKPDNFFKYAVGITSGNQDPKKIVFDADAIHTSQEVIKESKTKTRFQLTANISEELIRGILSYGGEINVVAPKALRKEIHARAKAILES